MGIILENNKYKVVINTLGAEVNSFVDKAKDAHYIWDGEASVWKYHAPILFPHVGRILDGFMTYAGKKYDLKVNGFSRDMEHKLLSSTSTKADFVLQDSSETLTKYPWHFELKTHYELLENGLCFTTTVKNTDSEKITFSLGSHSAFCCPRNKGETIEDYEIEFEKKEPLTQVVCTDTGYVELENNLIKMKAYGEQDAGIIPLDKKGFGNGHFFCNFDCNWVGLRNKKDGSIVKVNTRGYPYLMIWQNAGEPRFVCIEPWHGTPDTSTTDHVWEHKKALLSLEPNAIWTNDQSFVIE